MLYNEYPHAVTMANFHRRVVDFGQRSALFNYHREGEISLEHRRTRRTELFLQSFKPVKQNSVAYTRRVGGFGRLESHETSVGGYDRV